MKQTIIRLLKNGYSVSQKYTADNLIKAFYPLQYIIQQDGKMIRTKSNKFWDYNNIDKRAALIQDLSFARLHNMKGRYFNILNRFENGDGYGIEKLVDVAPGIILRIN